MEQEGIRQLRLLGQLHRLRRSPRVSSPLLIQESLSCLLKEGMNGGMGEQWVTAAFSAAPGSREGTRRPCAGLGQVGRCSSWSSSDVPLCLSLRGLGVTLKWKAPLPLTRPRDSPARWVGFRRWGDREKTRAIFTGRGWTGLRGTAATGGSGVSQKLFVQGCSRHLVWMRL